LTKSKAILIPIISPKAKQISHSGNTDSHYVKVPMHWSEAFKGKYSNDALSKVLLA